MIPEYKPPTYHYLVSSMLGTTLLSSNNSFDFEGYISRETAFSTCLESIKDNMLVDLYDITIYPHNRTLI